MTRGTETGRSFYRGKSRKQLGIKPGFVTAALVVIMLLVVLLGGCGTPANVHVVEMQNLKFNPDTITIKKGDTVRWIDKDQTSHNTMQLDFNMEEPDKSPSYSWMAMPLNPGESFDHTFDTAGTFEYHCHIHEYMKGKVIVEE